MESERFPARNSTGCERSRAGPVLTNSSSTMDRRSLHGTSRAVSTEIGSGRMGMPASPSSPKRVYCAVKLIKEDFVRPSVCNLLGLNRLPISGFLL
jgi:hypothetical protein